MTPLRAALLIPLLALAAAACSKQEAAPTSPVTTSPPPPPPAAEPIPAPTPPATGEGDGVDATPCSIGVACTVGDGVTLTVTDIQDSRCPANARCIQAGDAAVSLTLAGQAIALHTDEATGSARHALGDGRDLFLAAVEPFPGMGQDEAPKQAFLTIEPASAAPAPAP